MNKGKIGVVIVNYNGASYQNDALKSIFESTYKDLEVIIVDSASTDDSIYLAKQDYPQVHYILQNENVGFAKGSNIGAKYAIEELKTEYVLFINNDIVIDKQAIEKLVHKSNENTVTIPMIYYYHPNDMIWFAGGNMYWNKGESGHVGNFEIDNGQYDTDRFIEFATGCCLLVHRNIFEDVGFFDETGFMYFEDTDYSVRLKDQQKSILFVHDAKLWHKVSSSGGGMDSKYYVYYIFRNKLYFMDKYKERLQIPAKLFTYTKMFAKFVLSPIYKKNDKYILKAWLDYRHGKMGRCDNW